jgi:hypothetical protein
MYAVAFALDGLGDIYLDARLPLAAATPDEVDRLLGSVLEYADGSFNTILELGFASSIRKEWEWRVSRGEPTRNLGRFAARSRSTSSAPRRHERPQRLSAAASGWAGASTGRARGLRRATATPARARTPPA